MREITEALFALREEKYRAFHAALMPGVAWERVIGVRMPALRRPGQNAAGRALPAGAAPHLLRGK